MSVHRPWTESCECACNQVWDFGLCGIVCVHSRQQGGGGGVDTGLTVSVMCSDTQMAADTTQTDSHSVHSHSFSSYSLKWMFSHLFAFVPLASARLETHSNLCKKSYYHFSFLVFISSSLLPFFISWPFLSAIPHPRHDLTQVRMKHFWMIFWRMFKKAGCHTWMISN